jgi:hypothetical protein
MSLIKRYFSAIAYIFQSLCHSSSIHVNASLRFLALVFVAGKAYQGIPKYRAVEFVVGAECDQAAESDSDRVKNLVSISENFFICQIS